MVNVLTALEPGAATEPKSQAMGVAVSHAPVPKAVRSTWRSGALEWIVTVSLNGPIMKGANSTRSVQLSPTANVVVAWQSPGANDDRANSESEKEIVVNDTGVMPTLVIVVGCGAEEPRLVSNDPRSSEPGLAERNAADRVPLSVTGRSGAFDEIVKVSLLKPTAVGS